MKIILSTITVAVLLLLIGGSWWSKSLRENEIEETAADGDLVSETGIHWHPALTINIKGQKQILPANIGIGMQYAGYPQYDPMMMMTNMHTHDGSGIIHWEVMQGPVKREDVRLANFFAVWGKQFDENCISEYCNGPEGSVRMLVNGKENTEFENYPIRDADKIEIRYE